MNWTRFKLTGIAVFSLGVAGAIVFLAMPMLGGSGKSASAAPADGPTRTGTELVAVKPDGSLTGEEQTLRLPADVVESLGVKTAQVQPASPPEPLKLTGSLFLDAARMSRVHTRFPGE